MHSNPHRVIATTELPVFIGTAYKSALTVSTIMSGFRKTGIFPFDPTAPIVSPPAINKKNESTAAARTERNNNRKVKILFHKKATEFTETVTDQRSMQAKKKRQLFVPPFGCEITEDGKYKEKKELQEKKTEREAAKKRKTSFIVPYKGSQDQEKKTDNCQKTTLGVERRGKGPHKNSRKGKNICKRPALQEKKMDMSDTELEEEELCVVCSKWQPDGLKRQTSVKFVDWGQCVACSRWVHLKFCTDIESLSESDDFLCPICNNEA